MTLLVVTGAPRTKKNSRVHTKHGVPIPSKAWRAWLASAAIEVPPHCFYWSPKGGRAMFPDEALNCRALFYRDARRGDAVGYYQGLADLLEKRGVLANDVQLVSWDGSRMLVDRENPRVEIELTVLS